MITSVKVRLKGDAIIVNPSELLLFTKWPFISLAIHINYLFKPNTKTHYLKPTAIGEGRLIPMHKLT